MYVQNFLFNPTFAKVKCKNKQRLDTTGAPLGPTIATFEPGFTSWQIYDTLLVGGWPTPLKHMKVNWDDEFPKIWKNNPVMFQLPPTSIAISIIAEFLEVAKFLIQFHGSYIDPNSGISYMWWSFGSMTVPSFCRPQMCIVLVLGNLCSLLGPSS